MFEFLRPESRGVMPLVCAVCLRVVGAINTDAFEQMAADDEIYICEHCMQRPASYVEFALERTKPGDWENITRLVNNVPAYLPVAMPIIGAINGRP